MFELPWHVDSPLLVACLLLPVTGMFIYLRLLFDNEDGRFRAAIEWLLDKWSVKLPHEKKQSVCRVYLTSMAIIFGCISVFGFSVATGIIKNKEREPWTLEDLRGFERQMEEQGLERRSNPALDKLREEWDPDSEP